MKDLSTVDFHPTSKEVVKILNQKTQSKNDLFFYILIGYYFTKITSMMRATIKTHDRGNIPVNMYAINLAVSGTGKGHSTNIVEEQIINMFRDRFLNETFPLLSEESIAKLAVQRAAKNGDDPDKVLEKTEREFASLGPLLFSFDSGTTAAVKQMRQKLLMSGAGSMNMEIDEIGSNLLGNTEVLNSFLELFDVGKIKQKLVKNTSENLRSEEIDGRTPTNMMLYGTPNKLLNGGNVEDAFFSFLETGYARRCFFGYTKDTNKTKDLTPAEVYDMLTDKTSSTYLTQLSLKLGNLANKINFNKEIEISKDVSLLLIEYKLACEAKANALPEHDEIRKAELAHRYFKALKLAGTYAFIDNTFDITEDLLYNSIKLVEESGKAFGALLTRERPYVKLAKYISTVPHEVTHVDLVEELPFYKGSEAQKREMMTLAIAYGYRNNIIIKKTFNDGIEFLSGESLKETNLDEIIISYSQDIVKNYRNEHVPFNKLHKLTQRPNFHWVSQHLDQGYRKDENIIPGLNMVVIDVDETVKIETVKLLLKDYTYLMYTTKRHTEENHRFRLLLPTSHKIILDSKDYKEFMNNIYEWLPFDVDTQTNDRSRKWLTHNGHYEYNQGELLDVLNFIPKTSKNEERKQLIHDQQSLTNIERWFVNNTGTGNRSNMLIRYAFLLVETGKDLNEVQDGINSLNDKLPNKLSQQEIASTILKSAAQAIAKRDAIK